MILPTLSSFTFFLRSFGSTKIWNRTSIKVLLRKAIWWFWAWWRDRYCPGERKPASLCKRHEGCPGQGGETGADLGSKNLLTYQGKKVVKRQVCLASEKQPTQKPKRWSWAVRSDRCWSSEWKATYLKGMKVVLGRMERQVLIWWVQSYRLKSQEDGPGQWGATGVDLVSEKLPT